jgi:hypothetical protein
LHHLPTSVHDCGNGLGHVVDVDVDQDTRVAVRGSANAPSAADRAGISIVEGQCAVAASAGSPAEDLLVESCRGGDVAAGISRYTILPWVDIRMPSHI